MTKEEILELFYNIDDNLYEILSMNIDNDAVDLLKDLQNNNVLNKFTKHLLEEIWKD